MTQNLTIGFIGYGNMAQAIAQGFVDAGVVTGGQMVACAAHYDKLEKTTAELGVRPLRNALEVVTAADVVIIAIKPYQIAAVVKPLADELAKPGKIVVSIAAGWNLKKYQDLFATEDGESVDSSDIHIQCTTVFQHGVTVPGVFAIGRDNVKIEVGIVRIPRENQP